MSRRSPRGWTLQASGSLVAGPAGVDAAFGFSGAGLGSGRWRSRTPPAVRRPHPGPAAPAGRRAPTSCTRTACAPGRWRSLACRWRAPSRAGGHAAQRPARRRPGRAAGRRAGADRGAAAPTGCWWSPATSGTGSGPRAPGRSSGPWCRRRPLPVSGRGTGAACAPDSGFRTARRCWSARRGWPRRRAWTLLAGRAGPARRRAPGPAGAGRGRRGRAAAGRPDRRRAAPGAFRCGCSAPATTSPTCSPPPTSCSAQPVGGPAAGRAGGAAGRRRVVATDVGGTAEVAGERRVLVPPGDPPALAAAVAGLLADPERVAALRESASARAVLLPTGGRRGPPGPGGPGRGRRRALIRVEARGAADAQRISTLARGPFVRSEPSTSSSPVAWRPPWARG